MRDRHANVLSLSRDTSREVIEAAVQYADKDNMLAV
jgi:hypothetical protein